MTVVRRRSPNTGASSAIAWRLVFAVLTAACGSTVPADATPARPSSVGALATTPAPATGLPVSPSAIPTPTPRNDLGLTRVSARLDPDEHPSPESTQLRLLADTQGCYSGDSPRVFGPPFVFVDETAVQISVILLEQLRGSACHQATDVSLTIQLEQPLGDRIIYDVGNGVVFDGQPIPLYWSDPLGEAASERVRRIIGPDACESRINLGHALSTPDQLADLTRGVSNGPVDDGRGYVGTWVQAAEYFGAIERFSDYGSYDIYVGIVATAADLHVAEEVGGDPNAILVTRLHKFKLRGSRELWYPAFEFQGFSPAPVFRTPPCEVA